MDRVDALVYLSHAEPSLTDTELEIVLIKSRALNSTRGITGVLLKMDHHIVQYLEGAPGMLERTFRAIERSPLHRDITVLARSHDVERHFDRWHMGFHTFQRRHERMDATEAWRRALPGVEAAVQSNPVLAALVEVWHQLGGDDVVPGVVLDLD